MGTVTLGWGSLSEAPPAHGQAMVDGPHRALADQRGHRRVRLLAGNGAVSLGAGRRGGCSELQTTIIASGSSTVYIELDTHTPACACRVYVRQVRQVDVW